jgi:hypothetical protein
VAILIFTFSCGEKKEELIDLNGITPKSEKYKDRDSSRSENQIELTFGDTLKSCYKGIFDSLHVQLDSVHLLDVVQLPDRFGAKFTNKMYWKTQTDSVCLVHWEFKDSLKTTTAFYNWLDCFGKTCKTVKVGDKVKIHPRNILLLVNEKHILVVDSNLKINQEKWIKMLIDQKLGETWKFVVSQPKKGKASWMQLNAEVLSEIKTQI